MHKELPESGIGVPKVIPVLLRIPNNVADLFSNCLRSALEHAPIIVNGLLPNEVADCDLKVSSHVEFVWDCGSRWAVLEILKYWNQVCRTHLPLDLSPDTLTDSNLYSVDILFIGPVSEDGKVISASLLSEAYPILWGPIEQGKKLSDNFTATLSGKLYRGDHIDKMAEVVYEQMRLPISKGNVE